MKETHIIIDDYTIKTIRGKKSWIERGWFIADQIKQIRSAGELPTGRVKISDNNSGTKRKQKISNYL